MKLEMVSKREKEHEDGRHSVRTDYGIAGYCVTVFETTYPDGSRRVAVDCTAISSLDGKRTYLPEIYYRDSWYGEAVSYFEIQTTSYGALNAEEFGRFLQAHQTALAVVEILNREFSLEKKEG